MKKILIFATSLLLLSACSTNRAFTKGEYTDPERVILLDDRYGDADMRQMADALSNSLLESAVIKNAKEKPVLQVETVTNSTSEHIDMRSLTDKIRTALLKTGTVNFHNKEERGTLSSEYEYQTFSGNVDPRSATMRGSQVGSNFILSGDFSSHVQELGNRKVVYYKLTLNLTDILTGLIVWSDENEIKKLFKKRTFTS